LARTALATVFALVAFAANSILCRMALRTASIDPASFTSIRFLAGAITLCLILLLGAKPLSLRRHWVSALVLNGYAVGFSFSYTNLTAGTGALLLFGAAQIIMIGAGFLAGERINRMIALGWLVAVAGILILTAPSVSSPPLLASAEMLIAGIFWGWFSLRGRGSKDPITENAAIFVCSVPIAFAVNLAHFVPIETTTRGIVLAALSGSIASGLGYAAWYTALPKLKAITAANLQLAVPALAALGGALLFSEAITLRLLLSAAMVLGGVAVATASRAKQKITRDA
jgi:drug/metabolite transporter (DMT)-like permease